MDEIREKYINDSKTEQVHIVMPSHLNGAGRLFGGQLALWIDELAGIVAYRHCSMDIVTVAMDNLRFREAAFLNQLVVMVGRITYVGSSSMEVRIDSYVENSQGNRKLINTAFLTMVAISHDGKPAEVPRLKLINDFEEQEFLAGAKRKELRKELNFECCD